MKDPLKIPTDEEVQLVKDEAKEEQRKTDEDFMYLLEQVQFRRFFGRMIDHAQPNSEPFVPGMNDVTNYNLGKISEGRYWLGELLRVSPDKHFQMYRERKSANVQKQIIKENKEKSNG